MSALDLADRHCQLYPSGTKAFDDEQIKSYFCFLAQGWKVESAPDRLIRVWDCQDFSESFQLCSKVYLLAQEQNHHPRLTLSFKQFQLEIWTHSVNGLQESDFIFAAKLDRILTNVVD